MTVDPASLRILLYPAAALRQKAKPIDPAEPSLRAVAAKMVELMVEAEGVGLAAPQVGLAWRLFVVDVPASEERSPDDDPPTATRGPVVCINPTLSKPRGEVEPYEEGCLSLPDIRGEVLRPPVMTLTATDLDGRRSTRTGAGLLARVWQHELDHLDGVLIIDRMTHLSRLKNRSAVRDLEKSVGRM